MFFYLAEQSRIREKNNKSNTLTYVNNKYQEPSISHWYENDKVMLHINRHIVVDSCCQDQDVTIMQKCA
jgi:hypothetical protein